MAHPKPDFTIKWGVNDEPITPIADLDQNEGWSFLGNTPPTAAQFDYMMALYDKRDAWLEEQVTATPTETVAAPIEIATQAETDAGTDDVRAITPKKLRFGFSFSIGSSGYITFPTWLGGLIIQWKSLPAGTSTATWDIAFPNSCFIAVPGAVVESVNEYHFAQITSFSATQFNAVVYGALTGSAPQVQNRPYHVMAIGY
ncbi:MAG: hypothetical protein R3183_06840 [Oleiphilaceae bacterium]|nr:hypothetical protein [Oleiphilaceae bacterium]